MPWEPADAPKKTKKAKTPKLKREWADIADRMLASGHSEQDSIETANGVVKRRSRA